MMRKHISTNDFIKDTNEATCSSSEKAVAVEIIQDCFKTNTKREEFTQAIKIHGVTFLHLASKPQPKPTASDLGAIEKIARPLANIWPQALVIGGNHE